METYQHAIVGAGPGGYVAAIRASQLGAKVCLIEKDKLGGTCLNRGCIPTKCLLETAHVARVVAGAEAFGVRCGAAEVDLEVAMARKERVVGGLGMGIAGLLKKNNVRVMDGVARLKGEKNLRVEKRQGASVEVVADRIILAIGAEPVLLPGFDVDGEKVLTSDDLLELSAAPESLILVGGGIEGCEFACIFAAMGTKVTIVEMLDRVLPPCDPDVSAEIAKSLDKLGVSILTGTRIESVEKTESGVKAHLAGGEAVEAAKLALCVGRRGDTDEIGAQDAGVKTERGHIVVDAYGKTSVHSIYAIGDITGPPYLAHRAAHEGMRAAENALGDRRKFDRENIPGCIFTSPEIGSVGLTEPQAKEKGLAYRVSVFPFVGLGKAHALGETEGWVKLIGDEKTGEILGAHIVGPRATDLISEVVVARRNELTIEDLSETIHAHPTLSEGVMEAAHIWSGIPIHA